MRAFTPSRFLASTALIVSCLIVASCSAPKGTRSPEDLDVIQVGGFWQPHLLYLLASPHPRLYVEVDAVEGCIPSDAALDKLRDFTAAVRAEVPTPGDDKWRVDGWAKEELLREPAKLREVLDRAKIDPYDHVRGVASEFEATTNTGGGQ